MPAVLDRSLSDVIANHTGLHPVGETRIAAALTAAFLVFLEPCFLGLVPLNLPDGYEPFLVVRRTNLHLVAIGTPQIHHPDAEMNLAKAALNVWVAAVLPLFSLQRPFGVQLCFLEFATLHRSSSSGSG